MVKFGRGKTQTQAVRATLHNERLTLCVDAGSAFGYNIRHIQYGFKLAQGGHSIRKFPQIDRNKAAIDQMCPFEGELLKQVRDFYRVGTTWSSNAIEGNTLTESETKILLEDGLTIGGKPLRDTYEAIGHGNAYDYMFTLLHSGAISLDNIKRIHQLFYQSIDADNAGTWRRKPIFVSGSTYVFPAPEELEPKMQELAAWIATHRDDYHPVEFAAILHLRFVSIHPFLDGNGRTARLLTNLALIQSGYLPVIVPPILRMEYMDAIRAYQLHRQQDAFLAFIETQELETQKDMMQMLHIPKP